MRIAILLMILLLIPSAIAFPCREMDWKTWLICEGIEKTALSQDDKDLLVSTMLYASSKTDHELVEKWNTDINPARPPYDAPTKSSGYVSDAWVSVFGVYPSVEYYDDILVPASGKVHSEYDFSIKYPKSGKCGDEYSTVDKDVTLNVYAGDRLLGHDELQDYNIGSDTTFRSELDVTLKTRIDHYGYEDGSCEYQGKSYKTSRVKLSDILKTKLDKSHPSVDLKVLDDYSGTMKASVVGNYSSLLFSTESSFAEHYNYDYSLGWKLKPYYVIYIKAEKHEHYDVKNVVVQKEEKPVVYYFPSEKECRISAQSHFKSFDFPCSLSRPENRLSLSTDKLKYRKGEPIRVKTAPEESKVMVTYDSITKQSEGEVLFDADTDAGLVTAELDGIKVSKAVEVSDSKSWSFFWKLSFVVLFIILVFKALSKLFGGVVQ